jgi:hypothetical protein
MDYHLLKYEEEYAEERLTAGDERRRTRLQRRALDQLKALGYEVTITPTAA